MPFYYVKSKDQRILVFDHLNVILISLNSKQKCGIPHFSKIIGSVYVKNPLQLLISIIHNKQYFTQKINIISSGKLYLNSACVANTSKDVLKTEHILSQT